MNSLARLGRSCVVRLGLVSTLVVTCMVSRVGAQSDSAAARALFGEGRSLMDQERYEEACPKFEESLRLDPGMGTQFNLAHCWEKLGRTASAWALFLDVAAAARASNQPQREAAARERAKAIEPRLTRLRIDVASPVAETKVERDGQDVGRAAWGTAVPIDPGTHVVQVSAPGKKPWKEEVQVPAAPRTVSLAVPALEDVPLPAAPPNVSPAPGGPPPVEADVSPRSPGGASGQTIAALVVGGVGLAGIATGTIFGLQSRSDNAEGEKLCLIRVSATEYRCPTPEEQTRHDELIDSAKRNRLYGFIAGGIGGAALVTAIVLYVTDDGGAEDSASALDLSPVWADDFRGAALSGRF